MRQNTQLSTIRPYTTLFRSSSRLMLQDDRRTRETAPGTEANLSPRPAMRIAVMSLKLRLVPVVTVATISPYARSEEHTSELQSPCNLVCRLLLEKNNY